MPETFALAPSAQLFTPDRVTVDGAGNLYIADRGNSRIRRVSPAGTITTVAGNGERGYSGDRATAASAQLNDPEGIAVDNAGNLYIADRTNNAIRLLQPIASSLALTSINNAASNLPGAISPGEIVVLYGSALGPAQLTQFHVNTSGRIDTQLAGTTVLFNGALATTPVGIDGKIAAGPILPAPNLKVSVTVGGMPALVQYAGAAPGQVAGLMQVNVQIPVGVQPGGYVPIVLQVGDASTIDGAVWIAVAGN